MWNISDVLAIKNKDKKNTGSLMTTVMNLYARTDRPYTQTDVMYMGRVSCLYARGIKEK
jgi:hypothetical protein